MDHPLETQIAMALSATAITSSELAALIQATEAAVVEADKVAEQERLKALDPLRSPNAAEARRAMEDAAFACDRLRTVLPRLRDRLAKVTAQEKYGSWLVDYERVRTRRDDLAAQLYLLYPLFAHRLSELLYQMEIIDEEAKNINN